MNFKNASNFVDLIDIDIIDHKREPSKTARAQIEIKEYHGQVYNVIHGGTLYSLADTLAGFLVWKNVDPESIVSTIEMKINYLAPVPIRGIIIAEANLKHLGKRTGVCLVDLYHSFDGKKKLVATSIGTFSVIKLKK